MRAADDHEIDRQPEGHVVKQIHPGGGRWSMRRSMRRAVWRWSMPWQRFPVGSIHCGRRWRRHRRGPKGWITEALPPLAKSDDSHTADKMERRRDFPSLTINRKSPDKTKNEGSEDRPWQPVAQAGPNDHPPGAARIQDKSGPENEGDHAPARERPRPSFQQENQTLSESGFRTRFVRHDTWLRENTPPAIASKKRGLAWLTAGRRLQRGRHRCHCLPPIEARYEDPGPAFRQGRTRDCSSGM